MLQECLGNTVGNQCRCRRGASIKDEVTWILRVDLRVKVASSFLSNLSQILGILVV